MPSAAEVRRTDTVYGGRGVVSEIDGASPATWVGVGTAPAPCASVPAARAKQIGVPYLAGKTLGDLVDAEARATAQTLFKNGRPVRVIHMPRVDEFEVGALMMHFMLETIVMGRLMGVDPFDQPGVEDAKRLLHGALSER